MQESKGAITLQNEAGLRWTLPYGDRGWTLGTIEVGGALVETPMTAGLFALRHMASGEERWLAATTLERCDGLSVCLAGDETIAGARCTFRVTISLCPDELCARMQVDWRLDQDLVGWEVILAYQDSFAHAWLCHLYPHLEDSKHAAEQPLTYVGVPAALLYRDDLSLALLFGIDPASDYLNPTSWTGKTGFHFMDQVTAPQFRVGGGELTSDIAYSVPLQLVLSDAGDATRSITQLVRTWMAVNDFGVESLSVREPKEGLELFLEGRRSTTMWQPGIGYRLEEGDPESNFVYMGEQPLSAYFEYLIYEMTGEPLWRQRCFEQMDFVLRAQNSDPTDMHYGAFHTAFDLGKQEFDSDDRGRNVGYKPDLNAYMARYLLLVWQRVRAREGTDRQDWYGAAVRAADWVLRQRNADGGLPQCVDIATGRKSRSAASGRALPAMPIIHEITGNERYAHFSLSLEQYLRSSVESRFYFVGHHPDLPPDEIEEASIWGAVEYWLDKHERTGEQECLERALADAYLAFLWWCPKQLSWVSNPTQCSSAEQQHFLQYSIYCYQNRKLQCLHRLAAQAGEPLFRALYERVLQGVLWTQVTHGDQKGATHERIADPWLARQDYDQPASFDSLGTMYMGEQSLDTMLQLVEMGVVSLNLREE